MVIKCVCGDHAGGGLKLGELAAKRRLELAEQELAEAAAALARAQEDPAERRRKGAVSPQGAASRTRAGRVLALDISSQSLRLDN